MSSYIRRLRAIQEAAEDLARRINRPIDLRQAALDSGDYLQESLEQDANSLIPAGKDLLEELYGSLYEPSLADKASGLAIRRNIQDQVREPIKQGAPISAPMIASIMQLDR